MNMLSRPRCSPMASSTTGTSATTAMLLAPVAPDVSLSLRTPPIMEHTTRLEARWSKVAFSVSGPRASWSAGHSLTLLLAGPSSSNGVRAPRRGVSAALWPDADRPVRVPDADRPTVVVESGGARWPERCGCSPTERRPGASGTGISTARWLYPCDDGVTWCLVGRLSSSIVSGLERFWKQGREGLEGREGERT